ncbi:MAG TPA: pentapeptide repeat-containing protein [Blastocatellia bacterium]|nr:pentapeptide repeat-containing protein [Blastocatellia bacterium]
MPQLSRGDILDRIEKGEGLRAANLVRIDLSEMDLSRVDLAEANLRMADLSRANLSEARLTGCFLSGAILTEASLVGANIVESSMIGATLKGADLSRADLSGSDLTGANLQEAQLAGAYLVGTFLNETDLSGANLTGAFIRMAQMAGSNLAGSALDEADLSYTDLTGVRLEGSSLVGVNLVGANLSGSTLKSCDLRGADLSGADLSGCNLTGAKLRDVRFSGLKLADAWAEWVDMTIDGVEDRASLEEVFIGIVGKPVAQLLVEGRVGDEVWAVILAHLCMFQLRHPTNADVRLRGIHDGMSSSALYLEADHELSLAAYLAELADIMGKGSLELFEQLAAAVAEISELSASADFMQRDSAPLVWPEGLDDPLSELAERVETLQETTFWASDKAVAILTGDRQIWLEATSNPSLTLRPPHGSAVGVDLVRGRFITDELRRSKTLVGSRPQ